MYKKSKLNTVTNREQFKRLVIEAVHGLPYEEAIKKEEVINGCKFIRIFSDKRKKPKLENLYTSPYNFYGRTKHAYYSRDLLLLSAFGYKKEEGSKILSQTDIKIIGLPITIGRVLKALSNTGTNKLLDLADSSDLLLDCGITSWKLTKENGQECTDDDQSDQTINKLLKLLNKI